VPPLEPLALPGLGLGELGLERLCLCMPLPAPCIGALVNRL
jgi:hypothetical protein